MLTLFGTEIMVTPHILEHLISDDEVKRLEITCNSRNYYAIKYIQTGCQLSA